MENLLKLETFARPTLTSTWPCLTHNTRNGTIPITEVATNKWKKTKTTCRDGHKPGSSIVTRRAIKSIRETPVAHGITSHPGDNILHNKIQRERRSTKPLRDNRTDIDYSVLNDGFDIESRKRYSSRPRSEPTVPRQAAQRKIEETKIHLSSPYDNLDLEKIMDSQYPALQLVLLSGITNAVIDRSNPSMEEYITPVLGTLMVHGVMENKSDLHVSDIPLSTDCSNDIQKATTDLSITTEPITPHTNVPAMNTDSPTSDETQGVTDGTSNSDNNIVQVTISNVETSENIELNRVMNDTKALSDVETNDGAELNGVTNNSDVLTNKTKSNEPNI